MSAEDCDDGTLAFRCWNKNEQNEGDAIVIRAETWKEAAADFADRDYHEEPFDEIEVLVRAEGGALFEIGFEAEMEFHLYPGLGRQLEPIKTKAVTP